MPIKLGVKVGQGRESSAICVAEVLADGEEEYYYTIRYLKRLPAGTKYQATAERVAEILRGIRQRTDEYIEVFVDLTGLGEPILELCRRYAGPVAMIGFTPVYMTHGDRRSVEGHEIKLGKAFLVTRLQTLLQDGRLHLPRNPEAETLAQELLEYEVKIEPDANDRYGAFRVGAHDDQVSALGLAVQCDPGGFAVPVIV